MTLDWNMVRNASGPLQRLQTLAYLLECRYRVDAAEAGRILWADCQTLPLCRQTLAELRRELHAPSGELALGTHDSRGYLHAVLQAYQLHAAGEGCQGPPHAG